MSELRYYQAPDGTGPILNHPFCIHTIEDGKKVYTLDEEGNRIRSIRINKDGTPYQAKPPMATPLLTRDDFIAFRRQQKKLTRNQKRKLKEQAKAEKESAEAIAAASHTCTEDCVHDLDLTDIGESVGEEE